MNKFLKHVVDTNSISTKEEIQAVKDVFKSEGIADVFKHVQVPTLIVAGEHGERTTTLEAKEVADLIQHSEFNVYQHSSVYPFVEEQAQLLKSQQTSFTNMHLNKRVHTEIL